jgi:hypothetical protein
MLLLWLVLMHCRHLLVFACVCSAVMRRFGTRLLHAVLLLLPLLPALVAQVRAGVCLRGSAVMRRFGI